MHQPVRLDHRLEKDQLGPKPSPSNGGFSPITFSRKLPRQIPTTVILLPGRYPPFSSSRFPRSAISAMIFLQLLNCKQKFLVYGLLSEIPLRKNGVLKSTHWGQTLSQKLNRRLGLQITNNTYLNTSKQ